jgi:membrane-associated protease RseP (regulator of RpoE activity)
MAEAIAERRRRHPGAPVVALIGNGHLAGGHGVPHQLRALGLAEASWLLPWDGGLDCAVLQPGLATAVFGVVTPPPAGLRLGVYLETHGGRVEIHQVAPGSLAERSGLRVGDGITAIDGQPVSSARQVIERLAAYPAGRPLALRIERGGRSLVLPLALPGP